MRPDLRATLADLATDFATQLVALMREGTLGEAADLAAANSGERRPARTSAPAKPAGRPAKKTSKTASSERTPAVAGRIVEVVAFVIANPGCAMSDVQKAIGETPRTTRRTLADAVNEGSLVRVGGGRGTKYRAAGSNR